MLSYARLCCSDVVRLGLSAPMRINPQLLVFLKILLMTCKLNCFVHLLSGIIV
jgi:hypothetical protein